MTTKHLSAEKAHFIMAFWVISGLLAILWLLQAALGNAALPIFTVVFATVFITTSVVLMIRRTLQRLAETTGGTPKNHEVIRHKPSSNP
jgi:hypothetical protein